MEVGIVGVAGWKLAHIGYVLGQAPVLASDEIIHSAVLNKTDDATQQAFLFEFFEKLNLDSGVLRPKGLYGDRIAAVAYGESVSKPATERQKAEDDEIPFERWAAPTYK